MALFKKSNIFSISPREVQEAVETTGQAASYIAGNKTEAVQALTNGIVDSTKGLFTTHSGARIGKSLFKGATDYARGDVLCTGLCATSGICETAAVVIIWIPIPGKICAASVLKGLSYTSMSIRDLCAAEPGNPLC
jgi:hypothetical protein